MPPFQIFAGAGVALQLIPADLSGGKEIKYLMFLRKRAINVCKFSISFENKAIKS
jgi:hypothetical protein